MAKVKGMGDEFDQFMVFSTTQSAANELTFSSVNMGVGVFTYAAIVISRIEFAPARAALNSIAANDDYIECAICGSDSIADLALTRPEVYDRISVNLHTYGTPANGLMSVKPFIHDFTGMNGGGLLVPAGDMYLGVDSGSLASAVNVAARVWYRIRQLQAGEYIEIAQRLRVLSS